MDDPLRDLLNLVGKRLELYKRLGFRPREAVVAASISLTNDDKRAVVAVCARLGWCSVLGDDENADDVLLELADDDR